MKYFLTVILCGVVLLSLASSLEAQEIGSCLVQSITNSSSRPHLYRIHSFAQAINGQPAATGRMVWASGARVSLLCGDQTIDDVAFSCDVSWSPDVPRSEGFGLCARQIERDFKLFFYAQQSKLPISVRIDTRDTDPLNMSLAEYGCPTKLIGAYTVSAPQ